MFENALCVVLLPSVTINLCVTVCKYVKYCVFSVYDFVYT